MVAMTAKELLCIPEYGCKQCTPCPAGTYTSPGGTKCTPCPVGCVSPSHSCNSHNHRPLMSSAPLLWLP
jgi:hypothetical protein